MVGNNIAVVATSSLLAIYLEPYFNGFWITVFSSLILLYFGEILPKSIARDRATGFAVKASIILKACYYLLYPFVQGVRLILGVLLKVLGLDEEQVERVFSRKDMGRLVKESERIGLVAEEHGQLIGRFVQRGDQKVKDIMIPRTEIVGVEKHESIEKLIDIFNQTGYSRLPVIGSNIDEILGFVTAKDVFHEDCKTIEEMMREIFFIPETRHTLGLLKEMREKHLGIAIAVDEYGGTAGLVTLEDIIEEFFGEIHDEFDESENLFRQIGPRQITVKARVDIDELNERFHLNLPSGDYNTLGGLLMQRLGHIPRRGERLELETCTVLIFSTTRKQAKWVRIIRHEGSP